MAVWRGVASAISAIFLLSPFPLIAAGPPVPFDAWSVNQGSITSSCPGGSSCQNTISDQGMMQRTLIDSSGQRYYQTIIYDQQKDGTQLTSESFVKGNSQEGGISTRQVLSIPGTTTINSVSVLNTGWASNSGAGSDIQIHQTLEDHSITKVGYIDSFTFESSQDANENVTGYYLDIRQEVTNSTLIGGDGVTTTGQDKHVFVTRKTSGNFVTSPGSASLPRSGGMGGMMDGSGPQGGTVSWRVGDEIQVIWIGQVCEGCQSGGMMGGGGGGGGMMSGGSSFSYQAYDNLSDSSAGIATRSISQTAPINWQTAPFGEQPKF